MPQHRGKIPSWVAAARQQCLTFPLVRMRKGNTIDRARRVSAHARLRYALLNHMRKLNSMEVKRMEGQKSGRRMEVREQLKY